MKLHLAALALGLALASTSARAEIYLESNEFPNICNLEVSVGADAPNAPVQQFGGIEPPWRQEFDASKICYRISNPPDNCAGWTDWRCCDGSDKATLCAID